MKSLNINLSKALLIGSVLFTNTLMAQESAPAQMPAPKVDVFVVGAAKDAPVELEYPARMQALKTVTIIARVSGILEKKYYTEGLHVKKGVPLYKIEPQIYQASVNSAQATLALQTANFEKAQKDWQRAEGLYKDKAISEQDKDTAYFAYKTAMANVNVAKAELEKVSIDLKYTNVDATIDGIAGMKMVDVGDYVKEGTPLVSITQTDPIYAEFSITNLDRIKQKYDLVKGDWANIQKAQLKASLMVDGKENVGSVNFIDAQVDPATSTLKARAVFDNPSLALLGGQYVRIKLEGLVAKNVLLVPQKAVLQNPLGTIVFVVTNGKVAPRPIKIVDTIGQNFSVTGVNPKDVVIVNNFFRIKPDMPVVIDKTINAQE